MWGLNEVDASDDSPTKFTVIVLSPTSKYFSTLNEQWE
jgi:hypothetical protein